MTAKTERCSEMEGKIRDALHRVLGLAAFGIAVTVEGKCASLCGMVDTPEQRDLAEVVARTTPGVSTVKNYISINLF